MGPRNNQWKRALLWKNSKYTTISFASSYANRNKLLYCEPSTWLRREKFLIYCIIKKINIILLSPPIDIWYKTLLVLSCIAKDTTYYRPIDCRRVFFSENARRLFRSVSFQVHMRLLKSDTWLSLFVPSAYRSFWSHGENNRRHWL